ncbi:hypothetical protein, variant [Capsaspora owczarzaki ATCC 30864]|uniref:Protein Asterix n=1 Tax=Capsaspora owczarzaki (strain ATCC 30864) TaxID=595528 RepID=A0A0D2WHL6_CAPO3|nr:hypothetical protein, variant [Capsaspora owczarzaki ATCC 30864]
MTFASSLHSVIFLRMSDTPASLASLAAADPRRPNAVSPFKPPAAASANDDYYSFFSLILGMLGLFMKQKWAAWAAVYCCLFSFANMRSDGDVKQLLTGVTYVSLSQKALCFV